MSCSFLLLALALALGVSVSAAHAAPAACDISSVTLDDLVKAGLSKDMDRAAREFGTDPRVYPKIINVFKTKVHCGEAAANALIDQMEAEEKAPPAPVPVAVSPFYAKLAEVDAAVKDVAPQFGCYDQTDLKSCQQNRSATTDEGTFITHDWGDGTHIRCFRPPGIDDYMACGDGKNIGGEIYNGSSWVLAPTSDPRCDHWSKGGVLTAEFLACEAALPPKQD